MLFEYGYTFLDNIIKKLNGEKLKFVEDYLYSISIFSIIENILKILPFTSENVTININAHKLANIDYNYGIDCLV